MSQHKLYVSWYNVAIKQKIETYTSCACWSLTRVLFGVHHLSLEIRFDCQSSWKICSRLQLGEFHKTIFQIFFTHRTRALNQDINIKRDALPICHSLNLAALHDIQIQKPNHTFNSPYTFHDDLCLENGNIPSNRKITCTQQ